MTVGKLARLRALIRKKPDDAFAWYGLAMEHKNRHDYEEARGAFESLLEFHPSYTPAYYQYGTVLADMGEVDAARTVLQDGVQVAREQGDAHSTEELNRALADLPENPD